MATPDGLRYAQLIQHPETQKVWKKEMTSWRLLQETTTDPIAYAVFCGGLAVAAVGVLVQNFLQKNQSHQYERIPTKATTEPSFPMGARLLVAKHVSKKKALCLAWRWLEVEANVVFIFGCVMVLVWWVFFLPLYLLAFAGPGLQRWGWNLIRTPSLMISTMTRVATGGAACRFLLFFSVAVYVRVQDQTMIRNPLIARGASLHSKMRFLYEQHVSVPSWLAHMPWLPGWHQVTTQVASWNAFDLVICVFFLPTVVLSVTYCFATLLYPCCGEGAKLRGAWGKFLLFSWCCGQQINIQQYFSNVISNVQIRTVGNCTTCKDEASLGMMVCHVLPRFVLVTCVPSVARFQ